MPACSAVKPSRPVDAFLGQRGFASLFSWRSAREVLARAEVVLVLRGPGSVCMCACVTRRNGVTQYVCMYVCMHVFVPAGDHVCDHLCCHVGWTAGTATLDCRYCNVVMSVEHTCSTDVAQESTSVHARLLHTQHGEYC